MKLIARSAIGAAIKFECSILSMHFPSHFFFSLMALATRLTNYAHHLIADYKIIFELNLLIFWTIEWHGTFAWFIQMALGCKANCSC